MFNKILFQIHWRLRELSERICLLTNAIPVVVYTMGKVGSTSVYYSLKKKLGSRVMFTHRMLEKNIQEYDELFRKNGNKPHRSIIGELIYKKKVKRNKPVRFISLVRDPISKNISDFFQDFKVYVGVNTEEWEGSIEELTAIFMTQYPQHLTLNWFDEECFNATGINVYMKPFDFESGYALYQNRNIKLLLLRADMDDEIKTNLIASYLGIDEFKLYRNNESKSKKYDSLYSEFISKAIFLRTYIDEMLENKYTLHFFDNHEIIALRKYYMK